MAGTWAGVRERVLALREAPHWRTVFGADFLSSGHKFELLPVLTEEQVHMVERRLGVELPEEYRTFLLEVGAGGAGPDYGLFPVVPAGPGTRPAGRRCALLFRPELTAEFDEHVWRAEPQRADYSDDGAFAAAYASWDDRAEELENALTDGTLRISDQGCAYFTLLVVTGAHRGTVWDDVRGVGEGVLPIKRNDRIASFAKWYLHWLDDAERRAWDKTTDASALP
ncbi:SMI1/KNR4 family protein [Microbispora bryophytorum]|uniref:SMI1/KNR4 family protein n=1 Tax=Microbispora bryophytorum TaxID=1460882 RepID=UPI0033C5F53D